MHTAQQLALVMAAEKSKVPFYIAGGVLVVWALVISMAIGMRRPGFPDSTGQQRAIIAVSAVLVLAALSAAVISSGGETKAQATPQAQTGTGTATTPTASAPAAAPKPPGSQPTATTGTPAPPSSPAAKSAGIALATDPGGQLTYDRKTLTAKAGKVTIVLTNASPVDHDVTIAQGATVLGATPAFIGGRKSVSLTLKAGTYTFYCSVPGHRQAGMEGTLTVSA